MKKFFLRLFMSIVPIVAVILLINGIYVSANVKNNSDGLNLFRNISDEIKICCFGSSHAYNDYDFSVIKGSNEYMNFGLPSQTLSYDERILECYKDRIQPDALVFITVSYQSFFGYTETKQGQFKSKNLRYYVFLPKEYIKEYDPYTAFFVKYFPSLIAEDAIFDVFKRSDDERETVISAEDVIEDAKAAYKRHIVTEKLDDNGDRIYNEEEIGALYHMIKISQEMGAIPVMVTTPFLAEYTKLIEDESPDFYDDFFGVIEEISEKTGVQYLDYSKDERFCNNYELFMDSDHLNKKGAEKFTRILIAEVEK